LLKAFLIGSICSKRQIIKLPALSILIILEQIVFMEIMHNMQLTEGRLYVVFKITGRCNK
jgi:hypothetical protein